MAGSVDIPAVRVGRRGRLVGGDGTDLDVVVLDVGGLVHEAGWLDSRMSWYGNRGAHLDQKGLLITLISWILTLVAFPTVKGMGRAKTRVDPPATPLPVALFWV